MLFAILLACATSEPAVPTTPPAAPEAVTAPSAAVPAPEGGAPPAPATPEGAAPARSPSDALLPASGAPAGGDASAPPLPADQQGAVRVVGPESAKAIAEPIGKLVGGSGLKVTSVAAEGGGAALESLTAQKADVAILGRALKPSEGQYVATPIGYDGVVLIVSPSNKVVNLTKAQVVSLFSGKATSWKEVGGADVPVHLLLRGDGKTTSKIFEEHFGLAGKMASTATKVEKEKDVIAGVKADSGAIGFVGLSGLNDKSVEGVNRLSLDGVAPQAAAITGQTYPLVRPLNAVTLGAPVGPAKAFIDFCRSEGGQKVITEKYAGVR